jgi:magnesium-transporting ATPase (P-type)
VERDEDNNLVCSIAETGEKLTYQLLNIIEFDSARKRMSVIVRTPDNEVLIICKGADNVIIDRLYPG